MLGLPLSTEYNKRIPKQKFYDNISVTPAMKKIFTDKIKSVYWRNKIATSTVNISAGEDITEIEVFEIKVQEPDLDISFLKLIDRAIPYHIIFVLEHNGLFQIWMSYKQTHSTIKNTFKIDAYFHTAWINESDISLHIDGLNIDAVYENLIKQIAGDALVCKNGDTLSESINRLNKKQELTKQIRILEKKISNEKQFNVQVKLSDQLKLLKKELEEIDFSNSDI